MPSSVPSSVQSWSNSSVPDGARAREAISLGQQDALAGDEGLAQTEAGPVQETALLPYGM